MLVLGERGLDFADALKVFVELGVVVLAKRALEVAGVFKNRVENAPLLQEHRGAFLEGSGVGREELVVRGEWLVDPRDGLASDIPRKRKAGTVAVAGDVGVRAVELQRGEPRFPSENTRGNLVNRNTVVKPSPTFESVRSGQPKRAPPVGFLCVFVGETLDKREILLVPGQGSKAQGQSVARSSFVDAWKPGILGHAVADPEKHQTLRRRDRRGCGRETPQARRFQKRQSNQRRARPEERSSCSRWLHRFAPSIDVFIEDFMT